MDLNKPKIKLSPPQVLVIGFATVILMGAILLSLPAAAADGKPTPFLDALFTATSAVCVTGLVVVDTGTHYSIFGQLVIMFLIQIGGLGFMTTATLFALLMGKRIKLKERLIMQEALNQLTMEGVVRLTKYILIMTFCFEGFGAIVLGLRFMQDMSPAKAFYYGLFHAVSAFNNAGFDLFGEFRSLTSFVDDVVVNLMIAVLIIFGGLGFTVLVDMFTRRRWKKFSLHTKLVLTMTTLLLALGTVSVFALEYSNDHTLGQLNMGGKLLASFFQSVTPRTAGFNTLNIAELRNATQFLLVILMFIGASPGSTGGGIKTSTLGTLFVAVWSMIRGDSDVVIFERRIPKDQVYKSLTVMFAALTLVIGVSMLLSITEKAQFLAVLFETTSAFGTVGLSMGITPELSTIGRIVIILTMFMGRVGPLTLAFAIAKKNRGTAFRYAEEKVMVG